MIGDADRSKQGERRLMFRVGKANEVAARLPGGLPMFLGERPMPGFYFVDSDLCADAAPIKAAASGFLGAIEGMICILTYSFGESSAVTIAPPTEACGAIQKPLQSAGRASWLINRKAINIARLWALTGCRRNEIAGLKWSEVDFDNGLFAFEDSKTGKSVRPAGTAVLTLLKGIERDDESEFVFPADSGEGYFQGTKTPWARAVKRAELPGVTPHTLRHTIGSTAISNGEAMALTGAILGHSNPRSTAIYAHIQHIPSRKAANRVSGAIATALSTGSVPVSSTSKNAVADAELLSSLADRLIKGGTSARNMRVALSLLLGEDVTAEAA